jgi:hypothetical protein
MQMDRPLTQTSKTTSVAKRSQFGARIRLALREKLEDSARENGRSISEEAEHRLEQSYVVERALALPDALRMAAAFAIAGQHAAEFAGHPEWVSSGEWRRDAACYETAALAVIRELWRQHPTRRSVKHSWREWFARAFGYVAGIYASADATRDDLTLFASIPDFEAGRRDREEIAQ